MPVACRDREKALPDARRRSGIAFDARSAVPSALVCGSAAQYGNAASS